MMEKIEILDWNQSSARDGVTRRKARMDDVFSRLFILQMHPHG